MMYRAGWGYKDPGQKRILALDISREGFDWALSHGCPSHPTPGMSKEDYAELKAASPVRIQWDPERDIRLQPLPHRAVQIGLSGDAVRLYVTEWIQRITEVTALAHAVHGLVAGDRLDEARLLLPPERPYPAPMPVT
jgi:hypothetical protein